jgi:tetratricopeptide (TPR) repeat protein
MMTLPPAEETALQAIVKEFAGLPLALEQAAAYMKRQRLNFAEFWQDYQKKKAAVLQFKSMVSEHPPIWTTLQLALDKQSDVARVLFNYCAFLNGEEIPEEVVKAFLDDDYRAARNALLDYSLLEYDKDKACLQQHRLLQQIAKSFLTPEAQKEIAESVINQVNALFPAKPSDISNWQTCQRLLISALACDELSRHFVIETETMARLYNQLAVYLENRHADYAQALPLYDQACQLYEKLLGENHPHVATSLNNLAGLYESQGRYDEALPLYQRTVEIFEKQLGENHPHVATSLNNLAGLYESQGRYDEVLPLYQRSLAIREKQLGENHPHVATSLNNLATLYESQGRYDEALPLYQRSLAIDEKVYGKEHPEVATDLNNLAGLYKSQGRHDEALPLYQRTVEIFEKQLGENHPHVATSLNNLAALYKSQGRYDEALPLYQRSLAILEKSLGSEHPNTKIVAKNYELFLNTIKRLQDKQD